MKRATDFRKIARSALFDRWGIAVLAGLIAALLGASGGNASGVTLYTEDTGQEALLQIIEQRFPGGEGLVMITVGIMLAVAIFVGSVVQVGYAKFNLDLLDYRDDPKLKTLFAYFPQWKTAVVAGLLQGLYVLLGLLLFIIPGIIAAYNYAMVPYILAEHPGMMATEALEKSKSMMYGNRWRLFCLELSFYGWNILAALSLGIGNLWVRPYERAAAAAFYRDIAGRKSV